MVDEFLIVFDKLVEVAAKYDMELVMRKNFKQYYDDMCSEYPISMNSRDQYSNIPNVSPEFPFFMEAANEKSREYNRKGFEKKVVNKLKDNCKHLKQNHIDQQFEICGLYQVFAFRKKGEKPKRSINFENWVLDRKIINVTHFD